MGAADFKFVGDYYPDLKTYVDTMVAFVLKARREGVMPMGDDWGLMAYNIRQSSSKSFGLFAAEYCHTEYALLNAASQFVRDNIGEINKEVAANPRYSDVGVSILSHKPICNMCQRLLRKEFETMNFITKKLTGSQKDKVMRKNFLIKANSVKIPGE